MNKQRWLICGLLVLAHVRTILALDLDKLDSRFQAVLAKAFPHLNLDKQAPILEAIAARLDGTIEYPAIIHTRNSLALRNAGIPLNTIHSSFCTARLTASDILHLANLSGSFYVEPPIMEYPLNDAATALAGANLLRSGFVNHTAYKGQNTLVCIIDTGIDWTHKDFRSRTDTTKSRILYIWDQTITATGSEQTPAETGCNYGVEYSKAQIENELDGSPANFVRETDTNGHGTHVCGSAAGNGGASPDSAKYAGMAPEADILIVKAGNGSFTQSSLVDGISYARQKAASLGKAIVINMSLGSDAGPHDGTDAKCVAIDAFSGNGRAVVLSAGNSGSVNMHVEATVAANDSTTISITVPTYTVQSLTLFDDNFVMDLYLDDDKPAHARVITPNNYKVYQAANGTSTTRTNDGAIYIINNIYSSNSDRQIYLSVYDALWTQEPKPGVWQFRIINPNATAIHFHAWLHDYMIGSNSAVVTVQNGNSDYTLGNTANSAMIVGSYVHRWRWTNSAATGYLYSGTDRSDNISTFSSKGPTRTNVQKPDVAAPGQGVISSLSKNVTPSASSLVPGQKHFVNQGTSMSTPNVTGAVALLLQQNSNRSASDIRALLTANAATDTYTGNVWNSSWGYGKLDVFKAMAKAVNSDNSVDRQVLVYDRYNNDGSRNISGSEKASVRFTPATYGMVSGCFFHPSTATSLTGPLHAEIWSDNGSGLPQARLGETIFYAFNHLLRFSWNYIDLTPSGVMVEPGRDYHLVLYCHISGDNLSLSHDNSDPTGRSIIQSGGVWSTIGGYDFRVRPEIVRRGVMLQSKLFLEGPYDKSLHRMTSLLNSGNFMPKTSPFSEDPRSVTTVPGTVTDWVLVQLKQTATGAALFSQSAFLDKNGRIVADDGVSDKIMLEQWPGNYYVTVRHRNHFFAHSAANLALAGNSVTLYDFSSSAAAYYHSTSACQLESGVWGVRAGDIRQDGLLTTPDYVQWYQAWLHHNSGYVAADLDLDGDVDLLDYQRWLFNSRSGADNRMP
jgi:subtilisin family serine protease